MPLGGGVRAELLLGHLARLPPAQVARLDLVVLVGLKLADEVEVGALGLAERRVAEVRVGLVPRLVFQVRLDVPLFEDAAVAAEDDAAQERQVRQLQVLQLVARDLMLREVHGLHLLEGVGVLRGAGGGGEQCEGECRQRAPQFCFCV